MDRSHPRRSRRRTRERRPAKTTYADSSEDDRYWNAFAESDHGDAFHGDTSRFGDARERLERDVDDIAAAVPADRGERE